ncbi:MAG: nuclear transport factor 2 family protein [Dehalococcoidia bacterium]|nr:nuclear transport factor 2 family protein [Dehalococcoidia bacterium]
MTDPTTIVTNFVREFDAEAPDGDRIAAYFTDDAVYKNIPVEPSVTGAAAIGKAMGAMAAQGMKSKGWEILNQVASGNVVMNERVDRFLLGEKSVAVRVCGVFEIRDGKIAAWRDYFDLFEFQNQMK